MAKDDKRVTLRLSKRSILAAGLVFWAANELNGCGHEAYYRLMNAFNSSSPMQNVDPNPNDWEAVPFPGGGGFLDGFSRPSNLDSGEGVATDPGAIPLAAPDEDFPDVPFPLGL